MSFFFSSDSRPNARRAVIVAGGAGALCLLFRPGANRAARRRVALCGEVTHDTALARTGYAPGRGRAAPPSGGGSLKTVGRRTPCNGTVFFTGIVVRVFSRSPRTYDRIFGPRGEYSRPGYRGTRNRPPPWARRIVLELRKSESSATFCLFVAIFSRLLVATISQLSGAIPAGFSRSAVSMWHALSRDRGIARISPP